MVPKYSCTLRYTWDKNKLAIKTKKLYIQQNEWAYFFYQKIEKTVYLQGFWPKSVYLKCFGIQLKTMYLQGPQSLRPCCK